MRWKTGGGIASAGLSAAADLVWAVRQGDYSDGEKESVREGSLELWSDQGHRLHSALLRRPNWRSLTSSLFSPDGSHLACLAQDPAELWLWRVSDGHCLARVAGAQDGCGFSAQGRSLLASRPGLLLEVDASSGSLATHPLPEGFTLLAANAGHRRCLVRGDREWTATYELRHFDLETGRGHCLVAEARWINLPAFLPGDGDKALFVAGSKVYGLDCEMGDASNLEVCNDGSRAVLVQGDEVLVLELPSGQVQQRRPYRWQNHRLSGDGRRVLSVGANQPTVVWEADSGRVLHEGPLYSLGQLSYNGRRGLLQHFPDSMDYWDF
ncbi:hypothetical protein IV102_07850 [bacterium]|nr:hypothetical protein [bacterium]